MAKLQKVPGSITRDSPAAAVGVGVLRWCCAARGRPGRYHFCCRISAGWRLQSECCQGIASWHKPPPTPPRGVGVRSPKRCLCPQRRPPNPFPDTRAKGGGGRLPAADRCCGFSTLEGGLGGGRNAGRFT